MSTIFDDFAEIQVGMVLGTAVSYATKEAIKAYAYAVEDFDPIYFNADDAKAFGYKDIVAPAGFTIQYAAMKWATGQAGYVPQGSVHVRQIHKLHGLIYAGDCMNFKVSISDKYEKKGRYYLVHKVEITNQNNEQLCTSQFINKLPYGA